MIDSGTIFQGREVSDRSDSPSEELVPTWVKSEILEKNRAIAYDYPYTRDWIGSILRLGKLT